MHIFRLNQRLRDTYSGRDLSLVVSPGRISQESSAESLYTVNLVVIYFLRISLEVVCIVDVHSTSCSNLPFENFSRIVSIVIVHSTSRRNLPFENFSKSRLYSPCTQNISQQSAFGEFLPSYRTNNCQFHNSLISIFTRMCWKFYKVSSLLNSL